MKYIISVLLFTFCIGNKAVDAQTPKELARFDSIAHLSAKLVKMNHYSYSWFDDTFSKKLFAFYVERLDKWHAVFLQKDIQDLSKYETKLDDELNGAPVRFCMEAERLYKIRLKEALAICTKLLSQPFDLNGQDRFLSTAPVAFPANSAEQLKRWQQWLTWEIEAEMYSLQEERAKQGITSPVAALEQDARAAVKRKFTGYTYCLLNKMNHERYLAWYLGIFCLTLDAHSMYFDAVGQELYANYLGGTTSGIGIEVEQHHGFIQISKIEPNSSAQQSGKMDVGDIVLTVKEANGKPEAIAGYTEGFLKRAFEGLVGTAVTLNCRKPNGTAYMLTLKRTVINVEGNMVKSAIIEKNGEKIGYIIIPQFYNGTGANVGDDIAKEVQKLNAEKVKTIVLDLRNNLGGALDGTIKSLGEFLPYGPVIQTKSKNGPVEVFNDTNKNMNFSGPVVVLANQHTISCGDLFTAVMQDYNRALIMGSTTAGKGNGSRQFKVEDIMQAWNNEAAGNKKENFGQLGLTNIKYYSVTGRSIQQKGVVPDVALPEYRYDDQERESAQKYVLPWDSIAPVKYQTWNFGFDLESAKKKVQEDVSNNVAYKQIAENEAWLKKADKEPVSLNWAAYNLFRKEMSQRFNQSVALGKLKTKLSVRMPMGQEAKEQEGFLNSINADIYINTATDAALEILKTM